LARGVLQHPEVGVEEQHHEGGGARRLEPPEVDESRQETPAPVRQGGGGQQRAHSGGGVGGRATVTEAVVPSGPAVWPGSGRFPSAHYNSGLFRGLAADVARARPLPLGRRSRSGGFFVCRVPITVGSAAAAGTTRNDMNAIELIRQFLVERLGVSE